MATCVPCQKEIICSEKAQALVRAGDRLMVTEQWTTAGLAAWNALLDDHIAEMEECLAAGTKS
jgi:hypothetical protein